MSRKSDKYRLLKCLGDLCNGGLDAREGQWLETQLVDDPDAQALYVDYLALHACLHAEGASLEPSSNQPSALVANDWMDGESLRSDNLMALASHYELEGNRPLRHGAGTTSISSQHFSWMIAVAVVGIALFSSMLTYIAISRSTQLANQTLASGDASLPSSEQVVARITGTQNCLWKNSSGTIGYGSELVAGEKLELREGLAEITFEDGATVLLESPATFVVDTPYRVALHSGRMAAVVPNKSRGFRVHTRSLDIFDVGTEFGLFVHESGASEVHVFSGLVKADVLDSSGRALQRLELNSSEAARVSPVSTTVFEFPANEAAFVRSLLPSSGPQDGLLAYEGFDYPEGPLAAQNGGFGWAGPWFDISADGEQGPDSNRVSGGSLATQGIVPQGNRAVQTGQENRIRRSLATSVGGVFDVAGLVENQDGVRLVGRDGNQVYLSFLQRVSKVDDVFYGVELNRGDGNANRVLNIGSGVEETGYGATSIFNIYGPKNFPSMGEENTEANFIVVKITFGVDNRDVMEIFRNPRSLRDEQACSVDAVLHGNFSFDRISLGNFHGTKIHEVDEVRVGTHFLAVTGRWGGERGRLLRRITYQHDTKGRFQSSLVRTYQNADSCLAPLLATIRLTY